MNNQMAKLVVRRITASLLVLWLVATLTFVALHLAPGDPASTVIDPRASRGQIEQLRENYGFNEGLGTQYAKWISNCLGAGFGLSFQYQRPVKVVIADHLGPTLLLGGFATALGTCVGLLLSFLALRFRGRFIDRSIRLGGLVLYATPTFWLGLMFVLLFAGGVWNWLPSAGLLSPLAPADASPFHPRYWGEALRHVLLPGTTLAIPLAVQVFRYARFGIAQQLEQDYVTASRARGLSEARVLRAALRNSAGPLIQILGLWLPVMVAGTVLVETVFSWPGLGAVAVQGIAGRDYPLVLAITTLSAAAVIVGNLLADLALAWLDPRTRQSDVHASRPATTDRESQASA